MTKARTQKRSRSGAQSECLHCGKKLRGGKGLEMHIRTEHASALEAKSAKAGGK